MTVGKPGARHVNVEADRVGRSCERSERLAKADVAQLAERVLGKDEVSSSILDIGSTFRSRVREGCQVGKSFRVAGQPRPRALANNF